MNRAEFTGELGLEEAIEAQCRALQDQLGVFGYQCLCASAIYPRLRFSLSTYLAGVVAETVVRPKPDEDELLALFRLPWFRAGSMPVELRLKLIADLDPRIRRAARAAIRAALYTALTEGADAPGSGAAPLGRPPWRWRAMLNAYVDGAPAGAIERDPVFGRFMKRRRITKRAVARDRALDRRLGRWATNLSAPRPLTALLLCSASIIAAASADMWLRPMLERRDTRATQVARVTPTPLPVSQASVPMAPTPSPASTSPGIAPIPVPGQTPMPGPTPTPVPSPTPTPTQSLVCTPGPYIVFFDRDKSDITPEAARILNNAVTNYASCGDAEVMLAGHMDRVGSARYNVGLSQRMADSVKAYLTRNGIPAGKISTQAFGESRPRVPTADEVRELQNRRVEIMFGPGSGN